MENTVLIIVEIITLTGVAFGTMMNLIVSLNTAKRQSVLEAVTSKRMEQIKAMRDAMMLFVEEYIKKEAPGRMELQLAKARVELYIRSYREQYIELKKILDVCTEKKFSEQDYEILKVEMEIVLDYKWRRIKQEAGIPEKSDKRDLDRLKANINSERNEQIEMMKPRLEKLYKRESKH